MGFYDSPLFNFDAYYSELNLILRHLLFLTVYNPHDEIKWTIEQLEDLSH